MWFCESATIIVCILFPTDLDKENEKKKQEQKNKTE